MRARAAHAVFAAILLGSIAIRDRAADTLPDSEKPRTGDLARCGLTWLEPA